MEPKQFITSKKEKALKKLKTIVPPNNSTVRIQRSMDDLYDIAYGLLNENDFIRLIDLSSHIHKILYTLNLKDGVSFQRNLEFIIRHERNLKSIEQILTRFKVFLNSNSADRDSVSNLNSIQIAKLNETRRKTRKNVKSHNLKQLKTLTSFLESHGIDVVEQGLFDIPSKIESTCDQFSTKLNEVKPEVIQQAASTLADSASSVSKSAEDIKTDFKDLMDKISPISDMFTKKCEQTIPIINTTMTMINNAKNHWEAIASQLFLLYTSESRTQQTAIALTICSILGINKMAFEKISSFFKRDVREQANGNLKSTKMLVGLVSGMMGDKSPLKSLTNMNLANLVKEAEGFDKLIDLIDDFLVEWGFKSDPYAEALDIIKKDVIWAWDELQELDAFYKADALKFTRRSVYQRLVTLVTKLQELGKESLTAKLEHKFVIDIRQMNVTAKKLKEAVDLLRNSQDDRVEPFALCFVGAPGIGKSDFAKNFCRHKGVLSTRFYARELQNNPAWDNIDLPQWQTWQENVSGDMKYQDRYCGQEIHMVDDAFQADDDKDHGKWINYISPIPYVTNQASIEDKGKLYESRLVIATANKFPVTSRTLKDVNALKRRFCVIKVSQAKDENNQPIPIPTKEDSFDPTYRHLAFTVFRTGMEYKNNGANSQGKSMTSPSGNSTWTMQEIADMTLDSLLHKERYHEESRRTFVDEEVDEEFSDASDSIEMYRYPKKRPYGPADAQELPAEVLDYSNEIVTTADGATKKLLRSVRTLKFIHNDGLYDYGTMCTMEPLFKRTGYLFTHLDLCPKYIVDRFLKTVNRKFYYRDSLVHISVSPTEVCRMNTNKEDSDYEDAFEETWYTYLREQAYEAWAQTKGFFGSLASMLIKGYCKISDILCYPAQSLTILVVRFICWMFGINPSDCEMLSIFLFSMFNTICFQFFGTIALCLWVVIYTKIFIYKEECTDCDVGRNIREKLQKQYCAIYCKKHCDIGRIFTDHVPQCARNYNTVALYLSQKFCTCASDTCQHCVHKYIYPCDDREAKDMLDWLEIEKDLIANAIIQNVDEEMFSCGCDFDNICKTHSKDKSTIGYHTTYFRKDSTDYDPLLPNGKHLSETNRYIKNPKNESARVKFEDSSESRRNKKRVVLEDEEEENSSESIKNKKKVHLEDSSESIRNKKKVTLEEDVTEEACMDPNAGNIMAKLKSQMVRINATDDESDQISKVVGIASGLDVYGPAHVIRKHKNKPGFKVWATTHSGDTWKFTGDEFDLKYEMSAQGADFARYSFREQDHSRYSDITHHIPTRSNLLTFLGIKNLSAQMTTGTNGLTYVIGVDVKTNLVMKPSGHSFHYPVILRTDSLIGDSARTRPGDCGSPIVLENPKLQQKLCGMHIYAGTDFNFAVPLTQELLKEVEGFMVQEEAEIEIIDPEIAKTKYPVVDTLDLTTGLYPPRFPSTGEIDYVGHYKANAIPATESNLKKHLLFGTFEQITAPAALSVKDVLDTSNLKVDIDGNPNLAWTQFLKFSKQQDPLPEEDMDFLKDATQQLTDRFTAVLSRNDLSTMTEEETLSGVFADLDSHPLNMVTSAGEPYSRMGKSKGKKKNAFVKLVDNESPEKRYVINRDTEHGRKLSDQVEEKEKLAKQGIRTLSLWKNCLKDEDRPLSKVENGSTRLFVAAPFDTVILFRKYFGKFKSSFQHHRRDLFHSCGINPVSGEWELLRTHLTSKGFDLEDADFSKYDTNLRADFMEAAGKIVVDSICEIEGDENRLVMEVLWSEIIETFHVMYDHIFLTHHGNPSGNPLTTVVNCIVNLLYHWYAYYKITGKRGLHHFENDVAFSCFGDDVIYGTDIQETGYTFSKIQECMTKLGQEYTTGDKGSSSKGKTIDDVTFLKRKFKRINDHLSFAPLDTDSIEQQFNWTYVNEGDFPTILVQLNEACLEAAAHGKDYFQSFAHALTTKIRSKPNLKKILPTRLYYKDSREELLERIRSS